LLNNESLEKLEDLRECRVSTRYFTISKKHWKSNIQNWSN